MIGGIMSGAGGVVSGIGGIVGGLTDKNKVWSESALGPQQEAAVWGSIQDIWKTAANPVKHVEGLAEMRDTTRGSYQEMGPSNFNYFVGRNARDYKKGVRGRTDLTNYKTKKNLQDRYSHEQNLHLAALKAQDVRREKGLQQISEEARLQRRIGSSGMLMNAYNTLMTISPYENTYIDQPSMFQRMGQVGQGVGAVGQGIGSMMGGMMGGAAGHEAGMSAHISDLQGLGVLG